MESAGVMVHPNDEISLPTPQNVIPLGSIQNKIENRKLLSNKEHIFIILDQMRSNGEFIFQYQPILECVGCTDRTLRRIIKEWEEVRKFKINRTKWDRADNLPDANEYRRTFLYLYKKVILAKIGSPKKRVFCFERIVEYIVKWFPCNDLRRPTYPDRPWICIRTGEKISGINPIIRCKECSHWKRPKSIELEGELSRKNKEQMEKLQMEYSKIRKSEYSKGYREIHREKLNAHNKKWRDNNPDRIKELHRQYYDNDPKRHLKYYQMSKKICSEKYESDFKYWKQKGYYFFHEVVNFPTNRYHSYNYRFILQYLKSQCFCKSLLPPDIKDKVTYSGLWSCRKFDKKFLGDPRDICWKCEHPDTTFYNSRIDTPKHKKNSKALKNQYIQIRRNFRKERFRHVVDYFPYQHFVDNPPRSMLSEDEKNEGYNIIVPFEKSSSNLQVQVNVEDILDSGPDLQNKTNPEKLEKTFEINPEVRC
jgi:hypothetical protein